MPTAIPATRRARAAQVLREGGSYAEAAREAKVSRRSVINWSKEPAFQSLVRAERIRTLDAAHEPEGSGESGSPSRAVIDTRFRRIIEVDLDPLADPSITSNRDPDSGKPGNFTAEVAASVVQVEIRPAGITVPLTYNGLLACGRDPAKLDYFIRAATDFRAFLDLWHFVDSESGITRTLGDGLWESQEIFAAEASAHPWLYVLKARKLGETTIECAFDAWRGRFAFGSARVHLFSRRDDAAVELLDAVEYGYLRLPEWLQLPTVRRTTHILELAGGPNDRRLWKSYPANETTAVEQSCIHGHVDELARMGNPAAVWQAIEPTMAGTCHIVTTGLGPANDASELYRRSEAGDTKLRPVFIDALRRPGRDRAWMAAKQRELGRAHMGQEYPLTVEDALAGAGEYIFASEDLEAASVDCYGLGPAKSGRRYVKAVDLGVTDATVIIVLDVTEAPMLDVVHYFRATGLTYPQIQAEIRAVHRSYPGVLAVEANAMGAAVIQNLGIPEREISSWITSASSKARIIQGVAVALENQWLKIPADCEQLYRELRGYQLPDTHVVQDSIMALAIGVEHAAKAHSRLGRIVGIIHV